ncbi:MAG: chromosome partitioning protein ParB [Gammaproteobacteria bacterium GWE2_37_16]|nr:MAG: chromosome partitioning protein ParB [Gammaproteobacteria bacterium GWE2_37_16]
MSTKKIGLGKNLANLGLQELLSDLHASENITNNQVTSKTNPQKLPIDLLHQGKYQPRRTFIQESLEELANSIRTQGLLQPIIVRPSTTIIKSYEIIAGERRWRAAQLANLSEVPVIIRELNDEQALAVSLIENIQRESLNVIDEADALQRLNDDFDMTHQEIAETVGKSRTTVTNLLRLLNLNTEVKEMVAKGELEMGHARALLALTSLEQLQAANTVVNKQLSVRETEKLVHTLQNPKNFAEQKPKDPNISHLQTELAEKLGAKVTIQQKNKNKGQLIIQYNSLEELDGILGHIQ